MSGFDEGEIFYTNQDLAAEDVHQGGADLSRISSEEARKHFRNFIQTHNRSDANEPYRELLRMSYNSGKRYLGLHLEDLRTVDDGRLLDAIRSEPSRYIPICEMALREVMISLLNAEHTEEEAEKVEDIQLLVTTSEPPMALRDLDARRVSRLVTVPGIVIAANKPKAKPTQVRLRCRRCGNTKDIPVRPGFGSVPVPRLCDSVPPTGEKDCGQDPYDIISEKSSFIDQQVVKLQEQPEMVPTGEMPRHLLLSLDRALAGRLVPGARVNVTGVYETIQVAAAKGKSRLGVALRSPYLRVVGLGHEEETVARVQTQFTRQEEEQFQHLAQNGVTFKDRHLKVYDAVIQSIAPTIHGHDDIKRALACQLFGGCRKVLPDGSRLRGDINVLLLGDPSTAKSQMLKFIEKTAPIAVYTSGKGSSAAGLTASVIRDSHGEFYIEGGAMVLADGGVVCIDEFDKMRAQDRVAIHEAMEQQTISIAKAGITTILNTRTAVLAAANPTFGSYDDMVAASEQIDFQTTILSRFDLIFIVRDIRSVERDKMLAEFVINLHMRASEAQTSVESPLDPNTLRRFVTYCRTRASPRLTDDASRVLKDKYVAARSQHRAKYFDKNEPATIPITVRQLEAIVRLSESLAKMRLSPVAETADVEEAWRLFELATLNAAKAGLQGGEGAYQPSGDQAKEIQQVEEKLRRRLPIGNKQPTRRILDDFLNQSFSEKAVKHALMIMAKRGEIEFSQQKKFIKRLR
eukprot:TRINITY_DN994_c0_g1::TRINITY_DN994_c0_g1_i1::g.15989::m.15989 TRINITY_DN994_c0_g1::TRINITY_DN994_c0_g1_i1::g.15989  ORF type:complete len:764 (+),score=182.15,sp/O80786/MCM5_ARATH/50.40/0.0,MCM/PF00493.18/2.5e-132,MCM_N/PF14551.1/1.8e-19,MCM_N/PF14551.1/2.9e+03,Mg_chelatase/PF01078.16/5.5e+02,Mg_chelatase/PF01078.16/8.7e-05,AAA_3/PF07726.6/0.0019,AAA_5/PF07728.9/5.1e+03,AAA_5/PF07728.9/0.032,Ribosomal_S14/PF00253.16/0.075,Methyltransf_18/PF12847.2/7.9e+02,Methyltransf_18/PF12847.2/2.6,Methyltran